MNRRFHIVCALLSIFTAVGLNVPARADDAEKPTPLRVSLTRYWYGYQADPRKPAPPSIPAWRADGASRFAINPALGLGPWFSGVYAMWHRDNLIAIRRAGIDVALPVFQADSASRQGTAEQGLDAMAQALIEMKRDSQDYPLIGMFYDTTSLGTPDKPLDVSSDAGKTAFYDGIRRFFRRVPEEFRAVAATKNGSANIIALGTAKALKGIRPELRAWCDTQFQKDFGRGLIWIADIDWNTSAPNMDGYASFHGGGPLAVHSEGPIVIASIGPGQNATRAGGTTIRGRDGGTTMMDDWRALFKQKVDWIVIETWNDYVGGSAVAPTRSYGVRELDQATAGILQFRAERGPVTQALRVQAPTIVPPRSVAPVEILVQNGSLETWKRGDISASASWYQNGKLVEQGPRIASLQTVSPMGILAHTLPVAAMRTNSEPLPAGDYEIRIDLARLTRDADGKAVETVFPDPVAVVPIKIGVPASPSARLVSSDCGPYLSSSAPLTVKMKVRNEGPTPWAKGKTRMQWQLVRRENGADTAISSGKSEPLTRDVPPADISDAVALSISAPKGTPALPADSPAEYHLLFDVLAGTDQIAVEESPGAPNRVPVRVFDQLWLAGFPYGSGGSKPWNAGQDNTVLTVVRNIGATTWKANEVSVGYHWYYWDGVEAQWDGRRTPLPKDLAPGDEVQIRVNVTPPAFAGPYVLALDVWNGRDWLSTLPASAGTGLGISWLNIAGGNLRPVDLTGLFDVDGVASEFVPGDGDFAGGAVYPSEQFPPDVQPAMVSRSLIGAPFPPGVAPVLYPAGYFGPVDTVGTQSARRIPFRYPGKREKERNFIVARGQILPLARNTCNRIYLLAAATEDTSCEFSMIYADGSTAKVPLLVSGWTDGPKHGEMVGLECSYRHRPNGEDGTAKAYLYVYELPADPTKVLAAVQFPAALSVRVCAITADEKGTSL